MTDRYAQLTSAPLGRQVAEAVGLPVVPVLRRHQPGDPLLPGPALVGAAPGGRLGPVVHEVLGDAGAEVLDDPGGEAEVAAAVLDASGIADSPGLAALQAFFTPAIRRLGPSGRLLVLGAPPGEADDHRAAAAQRALEGFVRSAGKEVRGGATANLLQVPRGGERHAVSPLRFLLSGRSAYVSGQVVRLTATERPATRHLDPERALDGQVAVVTGAARGIGAAIAEVLAADGAHVVVVDLPRSGDALAGVANAIGGTSLQLDITAPAAGDRLVRHLRDRHGGVDVVVHNAGITRDKTLAGMDADRWTSVVDVNLTSMERLTDALLDEDALRPGGRIVCIASLSGIAGNRGQAAYAASKAGVLGLVEALAPELARRAGTINAVAPGFVETAMTAAMPVGVREAGRRMNSLRQGGLPVDVAEAVAWLAEPAAAAVNGQVLRVCGQSLLGA